MKTTDAIIIENARIMFRNFSGRETKFNREGCRNFCVVVDTKEDADRFAAEGWNVKILPAKKEGDEDRYYIKVDISFKVVPPKVYMITSKAKVPLNEDTIGTLDFAEIRNVDVSLRPYNWEVNGKTGVKAYLKTLYVTIEEDEFAEKYAEEESPDDGECPFDVN